MVENQSLIEAFLYECQCALFLVDINNKNSFILIKDLINLKNKKFSIFKKNMHNKLDLENKNQVSSLEIEVYLDNNISLDKQEIDLGNM